MNQVMLPSSNHEILKPAPFNGGMLQIVQDKPNDTHRLEFNGSVLASHPNGFSCDALAAGMLSGNLKSVEDQSDYIIRCGGSSNLAAIMELVNR